MSPLRRFGRGLRRAVSWHRRKLAVLAAVAAVIATVDAAAPPPPRTVPVLTARRLLAGGAPLTADQTVRTAMPVGFVPDGALHPDRLPANRMLTHPVPRGQVLTEADLLSPRGLAVPTDVIAPVQIADTEEIALLHPGDLVDLIAADPQLGKAAVVARRARVVAVPTHPGSGTGIASAASPTGSAPLVLVEVDAATATALASAAVSSRMSVVLR